MKTQNKQLVELWHLCDSDKVFASSPYLRISTFPQIGLLYLASVLRQSGLIVRYRDRAYDRLDEDEVRQCVIQEKPLFVGLYSNIALRKDVIEVIGWIHDSSPETPVIIGGPGHFEWSQYLEAGATAVVAGEAEEIISEIARRISEGLSLDGIKGVRTRQTTDSGVAPHFQNLQTLPHPAWDLAPPGRFRNDLAFIQRNPWYVMIASRGCPFHCAFCSRNDHQSGHDYRLRPTDQVIEEMGVLARDYGVRHVKFQDDTFGGKRAWLTEFCERKMQSGLDVTWNCSSNPMLFRRDTDGIIPLLKQARCTSIHFGLQSSTPEILKAIGRHPDEPRILNELAHKTRREGLYLLVDFIIGLPGETRQTIEEHIRYVRKSRFHMIQVFPLNIVPGTRLDVEYPDGKTTDLSLTEIHAGVRKLNRSFMSRPSVIVRNLVYILKNNPAHLWKLAKLMPYLAVFALGLHRMAQWRSKIQRDRNDDRPADQIPGKSA